MLEQLAPDDPDPDEFPAAACGCGLPLLFTPDGWQHNCAVWFTGEDHEPQPPDDAKVEALRYVVDHCGHKLDPESSDPRCADCGIALEYDVNAEPNHWAPAPGSIPRRT